MAVKELRPKWDRTGTARVEENCSSDWINITDNF